MNGEKVVRFADGFVFRDGTITEYRSFGERVHALNWAGVQEPDPRWVAGAWHERPQGAA